MEFKYFYQEYILAAVVLVIILIVLKPVVTKHFRKKKMKQIRVYGRQYILNQKFLNLQKPNDFQEPDDFVWKKDIIFHKGEANAKQLDTNSYRRCKSTKTTKPFKDVQFFYENVKKQYYQEEDIASQSQLESKEDYEVIDNQLLQKILKVLDVVKQQLKQEAASSYVQQIQNEEAKFHFPISDPAILCDQLQIFSEIKLANGKISQNAYEELISACIKYQITAWAQYLISDAQKKKMTLQRNILDKFLDLQIENMKQLKQ